MNYKEEIINALADVCKRARKEGYEEADSNQRANAIYAYERGLDDAWECARKIIDSATSVEGCEWFEEIFGKGTITNIFKEYSASEIIVKIKEYEEKQKAIGDEMCKYVLREIDNSGLEGFRCCNEQHIKKAHSGWCYPMCAINVKCSTCEDYEPKQKQTDDEIKVGDEVDVPQLDCKGIVIAEANKETILVLSEYMDGLLRTEKHNVKKTGRYFSEIGEMKKKMQVDDKDN